MPAVKTSASMPPAEQQAIAETAAATRCAKTSVASVASSSPRATARSIADAPAGAAGQSPQPRIELSARSRPSAVQPTLAHQVDQGAGVDGARSGRHRHPLQRAEAHRVVDRATGAHGANRAAAAEVADDEPQRPRPAGRGAGRPAASTRRPRGRGSRAAHPPLLAPAPRHRVDGGLGRDRRVKAGVEHRDLGQPGKRARARSIAARQGALCSGDERDQLLRRGSGQLLSTGRARRHRAASAPAASCSALCSRLVIARLRRRVDDDPAAVDARAARVGQQRAQHLGHAAPVRGRVDAPHDPSGERGPAERGEVLQVAVAGVVENVAKPLERQRRDVDRESRAIISRSCPHARARRARAHRGSCAFVCG